MSMQIHKRKVATHGAVELENFSRLRRVQPLFVILMRCQRIDFTLFRLVSSRFVDFGAFA